MKFQFSKIEWNPLIETFFPDSAINEICGGKNQLFILLFSKQHIHYMLTIEFLPFLYQLASNLQYNFITTVQ